jgi:hypothetical protein
MLSISDQEVAIRAACTELAATVPAFAASFTAARNLLLNARWWRREQLVVFACGIAASAHHCTCAEGGGPLICTHKLAVRILLLAEEHGADVQEAAA